MKIIATLFSFYKRCINFTSQIQLILKLKNMDTINFFKLSNTPEGMDETIITNGIGQILDPEDENLITVEDWNGNDVMFTFVTQEKADKLVKHFQECGILVEHRNVTEDILMSREKGEDFVQVFEDENYRKVLNTFLKRNLTVDMILDKISEQSKNGNTVTLTDLDKEILATN